MGPSGIVAFLALIVAYRPKKTGTFISHRCKPLPGAGFRRGPRGALKGVECHGHTHIELRPLGGLLRLERCGSAPRFEMLEEHAPGMRQTAQEERWKINPGVV